MTYASPAGASAAAAARRARLDHHDGRDPLALLHQLPRHLEGDERPVAVPAQDVRPVRAERAQRADAIGGHRLDRLGYRRVDESVRVHDQHRLIGPERVRERPAVETAAGEVAVQEHERRAARRRRGWSRWAP